MADIIKRPGHYVFKLKEWTDDDLASAKSTLETSYPRIFKMVEAGWGSGELQKKLTSMLHVDNVKREGFPVDVCEAIMIIQEFHEQEFGFANTFNHSTFGQLPDQW
jgi:hypothetical protein